MVTDFNKNIIFFIFVLIATSSFSQGHLSGYTTINRSSVYVGQPVEVTVSVFTSTWFTKGINPGNIKVNGAFTVYFRSLSTSRQINGKTYAGVQMFFNVFPYDDNDIEFPSLEIEVETPNEGDYKGVKHIIKTKPRIIKVKPIPANFDKNKWLVTSWMSVTENWKGDLKNVMVGDVIERTIRMNVSGTVSELIPPIKWDTIPNVSLYPTRSTVQNNKTKTSISATRIEGMRYLFEKEGEVIIPKIELTWYNPYKKKLYKKTLLEVKINIEPNPDLGMLASVKEQLKVAQIKEEKVEEKAFKIFGLTIKQFLLISLISVITIWILIKITRFILQLYRRKKETYFHSEKYYFNLFLKSIPSKDVHLILPALYQWVDSLKLEEPTLQFLVSKVEDEAFRKEIQQVFISNKSNPLFINKNLWKKIRFKLRVNNTKLLTNWINP